jgi:hypothetical protein
MCFFMMPPPNWIESSHGRAPFNAYESNVYIIPLWHTNARKKCLMPVFFGGVREVLFPEKLARPRRPPKDAALRSRAVSFRAYEVVGEQM